MRSGSAAARPRGRAAMPQCRRSAAAVPPCGHAAAVPPCGHAAAAPLGCRVSVCAPVWCECARSAGRGCAVRARSRQRAGAVRARASLARYFDVCARSVRVRPMVRVALPDCARWVRVRPVGGARMLRAGALASARRGRPGVLAQFDGAVLAVSAVEFRRARSRYRRNHWRRGKLTVDFFAAAVFLA